MLKEKIKLLQTTTKHTVRTGQVRGTTSMRTEHICSTKAACELALVWLPGHIPPAAATQSFSQGQMHRSRMLHYMSTPSAKHRHSLQILPGRLTGMHSRAEMDSLVPCTSPEVLLQHCHQVLVLCVNSPQTPPGRYLQEEKPLMAPGIVTHL